MTTPSEGMDDLDRREMARLAGGEAKALDRLMERHGISVFVESFVGSFVETQP